MPAHFHSKRLSKFKSSHEKCVISLCDTDSTSSIMWFIQLASPESIIIQWVTLLQEEHYTLFWISVSRKWREYELELEISQKSVYKIFFLPAILQSWNLNMSKWMTSEHKLRGILTTYSSWSRNKKKIYARCKVIKYLLHLILYIQ